MGSQDFKLYALLFAATGLQEGYLKNLTGSIAFLCLLFRSDRVFFLCPDLAPIDCIVINIPTLDYRKYISSRMTSFRVRFPLKVTALGGGRRSAVYTVGLT